MSTQTTVATESVPMGTVVEMDPNTQGQQGQQGKQAQPPARDRVELAKQYMYTNENMAKVLEHIGEYEAASRVRSGKFEKGLTSRMGATWNRGVQVKHVVTFVAVAGALYLVYEGVRYLLKDKVDLPGLIKYSDADSSVGTVTKISRAK